MAAAWRRRLEGEPALVRADRLYKGRAFSVARAAAVQLGAGFGVVSAGLGYVDGAAEVPGYDLTIRAHGAASVRRRVEGAFDAAAWWREVSSGRFSSSLQAASDGRDLILVALSRPYLEMLAGDLIAVATARPSALRLFGLSLAANAPPALRPYVMPYDERLERLGRPGTRSDFAPRALAHFVETIVPNAATLEGQAALVERRLAGAPAASPRPERRRGDDATIKDVIRRVALREGFRSGLVLKALRGSEGWACEQTRFMNLYRTVRTEAEANGL